MTEIMLWRRLDLPGHEIASLEPLEEGWKLSGTAIFASQPGPARLDYTVVCDSAWRTNSARVSGAIGHKEIDLIIVVDAARRWRLNGTECASVEGSIDLDLGFSPSTNLLPIRRLTLAVGVEAKVRAAWLPFPSLNSKSCPRSTAAWQSGRIAMNRTAAVSRGHWKWTTPAS